MSDFPVGWAEARINDIAEVNPRRLGDISTDEQISFVPMPAVSDVEGEIVSPTIRSYGEVSKGYTQFRDGDVIFAKITPCMENGKIAVARALESGMACGSTEFHVVRPLGDISPDFLWRYLRQKSFRKDAEASMTGAVGQRRVPANFLKEHALSLPPLPEQRRIVAKIDSLAGKSRRARGHLDHIPRLVEKYKQAILTAAFRGDLTGEWRIAQRVPEDSKIRTEIEQPYRQSFTAPSSWRLYRFEDVCTIEGGSQPPKSNFRYNPAPDLIRLVQIRDYKSDDRITYIPKVLARRFCFVNDIMIGRYGPPIFQILRGIEGAYNVALMKAVPNSALIEADYLYLYLNFPALRSYVEFESQRTAGQDGVNKRHLLSWPVLLPPLEEQREIVRQVNRMMCWVDHLAADAVSARKLINHLDQAVLAKAFRGELVPQDPADEPASALLDRIRAERAAAPKTKRGRKKAT